MNSEQLRIRIKTLREEQLKQTQEEFASEIGFSRSYVANIENGNTPVTERFLKLIESIFKINKAWLRDGRGEVFKAAQERVGFGLQNDQLPLFKNNLQQLWHPRKETELYNAGDIAIVPVYNEADAGNAVINYTSLEPIDWIPIEAKWLRAEILFVKIKGESMEPNIPDGSIVLIDVLQKEIIDGKIYLIEVPHIGATLKRVFLDYKKLVLKPDNALYKEKVFPIESIEREEIRIVGRALSVRIVKDL